MIYVDPSGHEEDEDEWWKTVTTATPDEKGYVAGTDGERCLAPVNVDGNAPYKLYADDVAYIEWEASWRKGLEQLILLNTYYGINPKEEEVNTELKNLVKKYNVPLKAMTTLIKAESSYRQYDSKGNVLHPYKDGKKQSTAAGLGQITKYAANLYGFDYEKIKSDWKYNLACSVDIFAWGYNHLWNRNVSDAKTRATRAYGVYHDGNIYLYQGNSNLLGTDAEKHYLEYYE